MLKTSSLSCTRMIPQLDNAMEQCKHSSPMKLFYRNTLFSDITLHVHKSPSFESSHFNESGTLQSHCDESSCAPSSKKRKLSDEFIPPSAAEHKPELNTTNCPTGIVSPLSDMTLQAPPFGISSCPSTPVTETPAITLISHRNVLAANSNFFLKMFSNGMKESFEKEVKLYVDDVEEFEHMIEYFYTSKVDFSAINTFKLLNLALQFDAEKLLQDCIHHLVASLKADNACEILEFAASHLPSSVLYKDSFAFVLKNFTGIFKYFPQTIPNLSVQVMRDLLSNDDLGVTMEYYAFEVLAYWAEHGERTPEEIGELLSLVRLSFIDVDRLRNLVRSSKAVNVCPLFNSLYMDALEYHASSSEARSVLNFPEKWKAPRTSYKQDDYTAYKWGVKWSSLSEWWGVCAPFQGYKIYIGVKRMDNALVVMMVPLVPDQKQKQWCMKAEALLKLTNDSNALLCPILQQPVSVFKKDASTQVSNKIWSVKIANPELIENDTIVIRFKGRICT